mmetsp:Transcript_22878/g.28434  ORF Transcript_22878/g.28434 Transcript_22878/m.28434 type:complete len:122 (+) Transcript_22878:1068-1433(+)
MDIVESMIDVGTHSNSEIIEIMRLMHNEMDRVKLRLHSEVDDKITGKDGKVTQVELLDYEELFKLFILKRKVKLLRFLFSLDRKVFDFNADLFLMALEYECYDMAALLFKEFFRLLRNMEP